MERFDVRRGLIKEVSNNGGIAALAKEFFDTVDSTSNSSFEASHGIITSIAARYENGAMIVNVANVPPDFDDKEAVKSAMDDRKRWTAFLDKATGYNSKKRGMGQEGFQGKIGNFCSKALHGDVRKYSR
jgi:hypothetical protein